MSARTFRWTVEIEVDESEVTGGIDLGKENSLYFALMRGYPYLDGNLLSVTVTKSPSPESIAIAQGAYKRLGYVCQANGIEHLLVSIDGMEGKGSVLPLCESKVPHGSLHTVGEAIGKRLRSCPECQRRGES